LPMHKYSAEGLDEMIDWIQSDAVVRGDGEIKDLLRTALAQKGSSTRGDSQLQAAVDRYRRRHAQAKKVTGAEVPIPRSDATGTADAEILRSFVAGKMRAADLRSAGLVETASNEQVAEEAAASDDTDGEASSASSTEANAATGGNAASGAKDDDA